MKLDVQPTRNLIDVAMGRKPADLVLCKGTWVCVQSGEFVANTDIAIKDGRIAYVGPDASHTITKDTRVLSAEGKFLVPGLLDGHMHVESGLVTVTEFVRAVVPHGTTGMFIDPHEIANVFGLKGVKLMADEAALQPVHIWVQVPSCVPSSPGAGDTRGGDDRGRCGRGDGWENVIGLAEMMNYRGVAAGDFKMLAELEIARSAGKVIGGHYASPDLGPAFHGYAAAGSRTTTKGRGWKMPWRECGRGCGRCYAMVQPGRMWLHRRGPSPNWDSTRATSCCARTIHTPGPWSTTDTWTG